MYRDILGAASIQEIQRSANTAVRECMGVKPGEKTLIISDAIRSDIGKPLYRAAIDAGADATYLEIQYPDMRGHEPPQVVS